jgi:hypothetical protein
MLLQELKKRWVALQEVMEYTGLCYTAALSLIDKMTYVHPLAEMEKFGFRWFKIINDKDYIQEK